MAKKKRKPMPAVEFKKPIEILHQSPGLSIELWNDSDGPHMILIFSEGQPSLTTRFPLQERLRRTAS